MYEGNAEPGCALWKQSMAQKGPEHECDLFATFEFDNQKLHWALKLSLYNTIAQKHYFAFSTLRPCFFLHLLPYLINTIDPPVFSLNPFALSFFPPLLPTWWLAHGTQ